MKKEVFDMNEIFEHASMEIICFDAEDIIKTSTWFDDDELPDDDLSRLIALENAEK